MARKYFGTDGVRGRVGESLINPELVLKLGWAAGEVLGDGDGGKILIGKDTRNSGYIMESVLEAGLSSAGMDVRLLGPMPTPAIAYLTRAFRARAGIVTGTETADMIQIVENYCADNLINLNGANELQADSVTVSGPDANDDLTVSVSYNYNFLFAGILGFSQITMSGQTTMRME